MGSLIPLISVGGAALVIGIVKYRDYKKKNIKPPKKWEGKTEEEMEQDMEDAERKTEAQKGMGRAGGPF
ncbi:hypothetical protein [Pontibacillus yanchengensis]|uniref:Uncharacterized protein n=1 Tax=Pontibacillus yanchengensis Y32 TaxID=1385514 RepID=A0A0A2THB1_9BACI|nr:hypothetical protein [Pontibacillus yanchengensis]KGP73471.1 hypothetical protein N782_05255 [Pontibacillus yanchengensis Y32]